MRIVSKQRLGWIASEEEQVGGIEKENSLDGNINTVRALDTLTRALEESV